MAVSTFYATRGKRLFDVAAGSILLLLALPVLAVLAVAVRVAIGSPILFVQERPGRAGRLFRLVKFRSMVDARDERGQMLPDEARMGRFARALRRTSLDELPELINVVRGEMSLVGPRPLLVEYLALYSPEQARRHDVRPGLTGWAEVNGRNTLSWDDRFKLDIWYADHFSLGLDLRILLKTVLKVATGEGVSQPGHATRSKFTGSNTSSGA